MQFSSPVFWSPPYFPDTYGLSPFGTDFALSSAMAYLPRYSIVWDGAVFHVTWQCHNKSWLLKFNWAKQLYYDLLLKYKDRFQVCFYSYKFMDNHIHLTGKIIGSKEEFSSLFQLVNSLFARTVNKQLKRRGQVVMDRFKSPCIQTDRDLLAVMIYQDLNAYRARVVDHPRNDRWTSYHFYAFGKPDPLLTPAPSYQALGNTDAQKQQAYCRLVQEIIDMEGLKKRDYSVTCFIGDPDWVRKRNAELKAVMQSKRQAYVFRQRKILSARHFP